MDIKFYRCEHCGNIIIKLVASRVPVICCGEPMKELTVNTVEASQEKHIPVVTKIDENTLKVAIGSAAHPMIEEHHIQFLYLQTEKGGQIAYLKPGEEPSVTFKFTSKPIAVYSYCNLHGLWKTEIK